MEIGRGLRKLMGPAVLAGLVALTTLGASSLPAGAAASGNGLTHSGGQAGSNSNGSTNSASGETSSVPVCATAPVGFASCDSQRRTDAAAVGSSPAPAGQAAASSATVGNSGAYDPPYLQSAYGVYGSTGGTGQTVAIVDAYNDPSAYTDLTYYRSFFGLPACSNQGTSPCFRQVNQYGSGSSLPSNNSGWAQEISLDLDMVSAICPNCHVLLVEASSASYSDLGTAVNTAVSLGAQVVSNSYGGSEFSSETSVDSYYNHSGAAIVASSGDSGYGVEYPAASPFVTAAGGTTLYQSNNTGTRSATETAWSGAGSGCSVYETKPSWQTDSQCAKRTVADVSAVADPNTGVWVRDTYPSGGWGIFGGTSVASPIIASFFALGGNASAGGSTSWPYANTASLNDITSGSNGSCSESYLCTAGTGYDGPTGLGTPNGTGAFGGSSSVTPPPPPPPSPTPGPFTLSATTDHSHGVDLSWTASANTTGPTGYSVLRSNKSSGGPWTTIAPTVTCATSTSGCTAVDTATTSRTTYWYQVIATNSYGHNSSNVVSARAR